jgi:hypothetical protein
MLSRLALKIQAAVLNSQFFDLLSLVDDDDMVPAFDDLSHMPRKAGGHSSKHRNGGINGGIARPTGYNNLDTRINRCLEGLNSNHSDHTMSVVGSLCRQGRDRSQGRRLAIENFGFEGLGGNLGS